MSVNIEPTSVIKATLGINEDGRAQKFFTNTCAKHMDKYVPFDKGNLADYRIEGNQVVYEQLYARYQYYGVSKNGKSFKYNTDKHPLAHKEWDKVMWSAEKSKITQEVQEYIGGK